MTVDQSDIGVLSGDRLSVKVDPDVLEAEIRDNGTFDIGVEQSFASVSGGTSEDTLTVMLGAGLTRLRIDPRYGETVEVEFDGFRYFPTDYEGDDRGPLEAKVDFNASDGGDLAYLNDSHPARNMTVADLIQGLEGGGIEVLPKRD